MFTLARTTTRQGVLFPSRHGFSRSLSHHTVASLRTFHSNQRWFRTCQTFLKDQPTSSSPSTSSNSTPTPQQQEQEHEYNKQRQHRRQAEEAEQKRRREHQEYLALQRKNTAMYCLAVAISILGLSYAAVPAYQAFCQVTGYAGTTRKAEENELDELSKGLPSLRKFVVRFTSNVARNMPWDFHPCQPKVSLRVGETCLAFFSAENKLVCQTYS